MTRDPYGLGPLLYALPSPARTLTAAAWTVGPLDRREFELAHEPCSISTFCKNPLHPGPCKGWKKSLGMQAPGALQAIEEARRAKVLQKRKATSEAKSTAEKALTGRQLASPLHAKKATVKHANILLGHDEAKAGAKADKVILNKVEIRKYSKIKAAHMNSVRTKHGLSEDPGLEDRLAEALAKDNQTGKDDNYRAAIDTSAASFGAQLAEKHCKKGDGDCDGIAYENLRDHFTGLAGHALLTGDDASLDAGLANYDSGKMKPPKVKSGAAPASAKPKPIATAEALTGKLKPEQHGADVAAKINKWATGKTLTSGAKVAVEEALKGEQADPSSPKINKMADVYAAKIAEKTKLYTGNDLSPSDYHKLAKELEGALHGKNDGKTPFADSLHDSWAAPGGALGDTKTAMGTPTVKPWTPQDEYLNHAKEVAAGKYDANPLQTVGLAGLITKEQYDNELSPDEQSSLLAKLEAAHGVGSQPIKDKAAAVYKKLTGSDMPAGSRTDLHQMFGPDGSPDHKAVVDVVEGMTQEDWNGLSPNEKELVHAHLDDAKLNGEPGATIAKHKVVGFETASAPDDVKKLKAVLADPNADDHAVAKAAKGIAPDVLDKHLTKAEADEVKMSKVVDAAKVPSGAAADVSATAKAASDYAHGFKSGTAKQKMAAYQALPAEDFAQLSPNAQKLILADLKSIEKKFLAPDKKAAAKALHDKLSVHTGGGAGSGGDLGHPNPALKTDEQKINQAAQFVGEFLPSVTGLNNGPAAAAGAKTFLTTAQTTGTLPQVVNVLAEQYAKHALDKLKSMHEGGPHGGLDQNTVDAAVPALAAEIKQQLLGEGGATPLLNSWHQAISIGDPAAASDFLKAAHGPTAAASDASITPSAGMPSSKATAHAAAGLLWFEANGPGAITQADGAPSSADLTKQLDLAYGNQAKYDDFADAMGDNLAAASMKSAWAHAGLTPAQAGELGADPSYDKLNTALYKEFVQAIKEGKGVTPTGGVNDQMHAAAAEVDQAVKDAMAKTGLPADAPSMQYLQTELMKAKIQEMMGVGPSGGSGSGGATPSIPAPSAPPAKPFSTTPIGSGSGITHIPEPKQQQILADLKGLPIGKYLTDDKGETYDNLLALASAHGTDAEPMSVLQVLQSIDAQTAKKFGVPNGSLWEKAFADWLATPEGKAHVDANPTPSSSLVKKIKGVFDLPEGIDLKPGQKVQPASGGPGPFDTAKPSSAFKPMSPAQAATAWGPYLTGPDKLTSDQKAGQSVYTGGSYVTINNYLRADHIATISAPLKVAILNAQAGMRPMPQDTLLARGTGWEQFPPGFRSVEGVKKLIGKKISDEAFLSTSVGGNAAFGGPVKLEIEAPKGTMASYVNSFSQHPSENEMMLAAGTQYQVISVKTVGSQAVVRLRVVSK